MGDIDYGKIFECLPKITGLPLRRKGRNWFGQCYITGARHRDRQDKLVVSRDPSGGIVLLEQGGESMQLWKWMLIYGGCSSDFEVAKRLKEMTTGYIDIPVMPVVEEAPAIYVDKSKLSIALTGVGVIEDNLFKWLCTKFSRDEVIRAYKRYNITPCYLWDGRIATQFWYVDEDGNICHDKQMIYHENGRRDHAYGGGREYRTKSGFKHRCYFGEHLGTNGLVYVVESEKTALLGYLDSGRKYIATGGSNNIRRMKPNYRLMPDYDEAGMEWVKKFPPEMIIKWWENPDNSDAKRGDDMGDVIYRRLMNYG